MLVNAEIIARILTAFLAIAQNNKNKFDERDVQRVNDTKHWWVERFALVSKTEEQAISKLSNCMEWRNSIKMNDLNDKSFPQELHNLGIITLDKKDKEGRPIFWFQLNRYSPSATTKNIKLFSIYHNEKLDRQVTQEGWAVVVDCSGAGLSNVNLDYFMGVVTLFQDYYPLGVKYLLVVNLPFLIETTSKVMFQFFNEFTRKVIKFINKEELKNYMNPDLIPEHLKRKNHIIGSFFG